MSSAQTEKLPPVPSKESRDEYETMLKRDFDGLTIDDMLKDEKFSKITDTEAFKALVSAKAEDAPEVPVEEEKVTPVPKAPTSELAIAAEVNVVQNMTGMVSVEEPDVEPSVPDFPEPEWRINEINLNAKVELEDVGPLEAIKKSGVEDLENKVTFSPHTKFGKMVHAFAQLFTPIGRVKLHKEDDEYVPLSTHCFLPAEKRQLLPLRKLMHDVGDVDDDAGMRVLGNPNEISEADDAELQDAVIEISVVARVPAHDDMFGRSVLCKKVLINPSRLYLISRAQSAFTWVHQTMTEFLDSMQLAPNRRVKLRTALASDMDNVTATSATLHRFMRRTVPGSDEHYAAICDLPAKHESLYDGICARSLMKARGAVVDILPGERMLNLHGVPNAPQFTNALNKLSASEGAKFAQDMSAFCIGGRNTRLTFNLESEAYNDTQYLTPLCCAANMLMFDMAYLPEDEVRKLLMGVLVPFYALDATVAAFHGEGGVARVATPGAGDIVDLILRSDDLAALELPKVTARFSGTRAARTDNYRNVRYGLKAFIIDVLQTRFGRIRAETKQRLNGGRDTPMPFLPDRGVSVPNAVMHGRDLNRHDFYTSSSQHIFTQIAAYSDMLGGLTNVRIGDFMSQNVLKNPETLACGMSAVNTVIMRSSMEVDHLPPVGASDLSARSIKIEGQGALSFIVWGAKLRGEGSGPYNLYKKEELTKLPSLYPVLLYFERAMCVTVFQHFREQRYHIRKRDGLIRLVIELLQMYFSKIGRDTEERVSYYFIHYGDFLDSEDAIQYTIPIELQRPLVSRPIDPEVLRLQNGTRPEGFALLEDRDGDTADIVRRRLTAMNRSGAVTTIFKPHASYHKVTPRVLISAEPLRSVTVMTKERTVIAMYAESAPEEEAVISLDTLLETSQYMLTHDLSTGAIRELLRLYNVTQGEQYTHVEVKCGAAPIEYVEIQGPRDIIADEVGISVIEDDDLREFKYTIKAVKVYYQRLPLTAWDLDLGERLNKTFRTYVHVDLDNILSGLVSYGTVKHDALDWFPNGRLVDGTGRTIVCPMTLTSRESEEVVLHAELENLLM
jgi:hypothetical protein